MKTKTAAKHTPGPRTWAQLKLDPRVSYCDVETDEGELQYWVGLKDGWHIRGAAGEHTIHETSIRSVLRGFNPEPCECSENCRAAIAKSEGQP